jgi:peptidyl-prolyl cis-trans isomerase A (cyclophilin A)
MRTVCFIALAFALAACGSKDEGAAKSSADTAKTASNTAEKKAEPKKAEPKKAEPKKAAAAPGSQPAGAAQPGAAQPAAAADAKPAGENHPALFDPSKATEKAPEKYAVKLTTTKGDMIIDVTRAWSPNGADRFYNLVKIGFFEDIAMFRVIAGFMAQMGISGDPKVAKAWREAAIKDDPVKESNKPGYVTFATSGPNTRTTQFFINFGNNGRLDGMGFSPFGKLRDMTTLNKIYSGYGEGAPRGRGPSQGRLQAEGNAYLKREFPELDYIKNATIIEPAAK